MEGSLKLKLLDSEYEETNKKVLVVDELDSLDLIPMLRVDSEPVNYELIHSELIHSEPIN
jgi:hypothetical protein